jgi:hypothetical protein
VQWEARHLAARLRTLRGTLAFLNEKPRQKAGAVNIEDVALALAPASDGGNTTRVRQLDPALRISNQQRR